MSFGAKLKALIDEKGVTIAELSRATGINKNSLYSYIRRGTQKADPSVLQTLSATLGVNVYYFLTPEREEGPSSEGGEAERKIISLLTALPDGKKEEALNYLRYLATTVEN